MIIEKNKILYTKGKKPILFDTYYTPSNMAKPIVVFCHGYKGFKDWGAWHLVAESFANAGYFFLKFNFSHNGGTVEQPIDFPDLEAFAQNNYSHELDDLDRILNYLNSENEYTSLLNLKKICLIGHSRGGGIVLVKAEESEMVTHVITWAGLSDFKVRFQEGSEGFKQWRETGRTYVENGRTKQQMPHDWQFYEDFKLNEHRLSIRRAVQNLTIPQLIVHGSLDPTVPISDAKKINNWNPSSKLVIISDSDHVFGSSHPWIDTRLPSDLNNAFNLSLEFIEDPV